MWLRNHVRSRNQDKSQRSHRQMSQLQSHIFFSSFCFPAFLSFHSFHLCCFVFDGLFLWFFICTQFQFQLFQVFTISISIILGSNASIQPYQPKRIFLLLSFVLFFQLYSSSSIPFFFNFIRLLQLSSCM